MARPLRIDIEDGWYHVTARGIERRDIFTEDAERRHFLELLEETVSRFGVVIHAYVLPTNHYHLVVQTPGANLSAAIQWLNVSYVAWFNRRNDRVGPLFQGRFKSVPVQDSAWAYELSLYVHLNPVMRAAHGLDKRSKKVEGHGLRAPSPEVVTHRLAELRRYRWSSYRAYAGYEKAPDWLTTGEILARAARKTAERASTYRADVKNRLTRGVSPELAEQLKDGFALGAEAFASRVRDMARGGREISGTRTLRRKRSFDEVVRIVEEVRGEPRSAFMRRRGDWGRSLALWAARRFCGLTLRELGLAAGNMDYSAVAMAIRRFEQKSEKDRKLRSLMKRVATKCAK